NNGGVRIFSEAQIVSKRVTINVMPSAIIENFCYSLAELTRNSKPVIEYLTHLAAKHKDHAEEIADTIVLYTFKAKNEVQLPYLYLIDSLIKNIGEPYRSLLFPMIHDVFVYIFYMANYQTKAALFKLFISWLKVIPKDILQKINHNIKNCDPLWPLDTIANIQITKELEYKPPVAPSPGMSSRTVNPSKPSYDISCKIAEKYLKLKSLQKDRRIIDNDLEKLKVTIYHHLRQNYYGDSNYCNPHSYPNPRTYPMYQDSANPPMFIRKPPIGDFYHPYRNQQPRHHSQVEFRNNRQRVDVYSDPFDHYYQESVGMNNDRFSGQNHRYPNDTHNPPSYIDSSTYNSYKHVAYSSRSRPTTEYNGPAITHKRQDNFINTPPPKILNNYTQPNQSILEVFNKFAQKATTEKISPRSDFLLETTKLTDPLKDDEYKQLYSRHLDSHYYRNLRKGKDTYNWRPFYLKFECWLNLDDLNDLKRDETSLNQSEVTQSPTCTIKAEHPNEDFCSACLEKLIVFWNESAGEWHYKDVVIVDLKVNLLR
ncbi:hypothetical protein HZS_3042, partial [Henneguya salminicola]